MLSIPEVSEAQAKGVVRIIYADIRKTLSVPFVNLIYRHLATEPAVLDCVWHAIRPHFLSGDFATQAVLIRQVAAGIVEQWPLQYAQVSSEFNRDAAVRLIRMYNEANSLNLAALMHILSSSSSGKAYKPLSPEQLEESIHTPTPAATQSPLPSLPAFNALHECDVARIHRLNQYAEPGVPTIVASLYRHLAAWPGTLQSVQQILEPLQSQGLLDEGRKTIIQAATQIVATHPFAIPTLIDAFYEDYEACLQQFTKITISKMIPIGTVLIQTLGARTDSSLT